MTLRELLKPYRKYSLHHKIILAVEQDNGEKPELREYQVADFFDDGKSPFGLSHLREQELDSDVIDWEAGDHQLHIHILPQEDVKGIDIETLPSDKRLDAAVATFECIKLLCEQRIEEVCKMHNTVDGILYTRIKEMTDQYFKMLKK